MDNKAKELVDKFLMVMPLKNVPNDYAVYGRAKQAAIICVDEILKVNKDAWSRIPDIGEFEDYIPYIYWQQVKSAIKKL